MQTLCSLRIKSKPLHSHHYWLQANLLIVKSSDAEMLCGANYKDDGLKTDPVLKEQLEYTKVHEMTPSGFQTVLVSNTPPLAATC